MTNFVYNSNVPNPPDNPSADVGDMQVNSQSISGLIAIDHIGFNLTNGGAHNQVQLKNVTGSTPPGGLIGNGFETLYAQAIAGSGELFFTRGSSGVGIQLTGPGTPVAAPNGYTFFPGGLLYQWGVVYTTGTGSFASGTATGSVTFATANIAFPTNCFSIMTTLLYNAPTNAGAGLPGDTGTIGINNAAGQPNNTGFQWNFKSNSTKYIGFLWVAIGN